MNNNKDAVDNCFNGRYCSDRHDIIDDDKPGEECGIFGIYGHPTAAEMTYLGLYALQHRGQESTGIVTSDETDMFYHRGLVPPRKIWNGDHQRRDAVDTRPHPLRPQIGVDLSNELLVNTLFHCAA